MRFYSCCVKRILDFVIAFIALLLLFPFLLFIALLIKIDSNGPALYKQKRLGLDQNIFILFKFRSMSHKDRKEHRQIFSGDTEVTKIGNLIRRTKIDELPQLINVLLGEMSVVGPRPCLPSVKDKFGKFANYRFQVKPGLTSLAAVKGSVYLNWEQKGIYDYLYVRKISFFLDIFIIYKTFKVVLFGEKRMFAGSK